MKGVMYHYVREHDAAAPHFQYLHVEDFRRQLDYFAASDRFVGREEFLGIVSGRPVPEDGILLTFDDGLADHATYVLDELSARGLWALFFVSALPHAEGRLLDVHRVHHLLGTFGGAEVLRVVERTLRDDGLGGDVARPNPVAAYSDQTLDDATRRVKRLLNYDLDRTARSNIVDVAFAELCGGEEEALVGKYYASMADLRRMQDAGLMIGSHAFSHAPMADLDAAAQRHEIVRSFEVLDDGGIESAPRTFCYPYGRPETFTVETERMLAEAGVRVAFAFDNRPIIEDEFRARPLAAPRLNCNVFPHGQVSTGPRRPE